MTPSNQTGQTSQTGLSSQTETTRATVIAPSPAALHGLIPPEPGNLQPHHFAAYPAEARTLALAHLAVLRTIPLPLLPVLLREIAKYDDKFPVERLRLERQLRWLEQLTPVNRQSLFSPFGALRLPSTLGQLNWVYDPVAYMEQLTADLWSSNTMPQFRSASEAYAEQLRSDVAEVQPAHPRLCLVVLDKSLRAVDGRGAAFGKLRPHGITLSRLKAQDGFARLLRHVEARTAQPHPFTHWYVDGGPAEPVRSEVTTTSYTALEPVRRELLALAHSAMSRPRSGPEELRSLLAQLKPADLGLSHTNADRILTEFQLSLMTEGSGTQIFATTFVQWAGREILRRAEPETLLLRFRPRQQQQPMNELMGGAPSRGPDFAGSLIDAEQAAYSTWLNLGRLSGAEQSLFLAWQQGSDQAVAIGPGLLAGGSSIMPRYLDDTLAYLERQSLA